MHVGDTQVIQLAICCTLRTVNVHGLIDKERKKQGRKSFRVPSNSPNKIKTLKKNLFQCGICRGCRRDTKGLTYLRKSKLKVACIEIQVQMPSSAMDELTMLCFINSSFIHSFIRFICCLSHSEMQL